MRAIILAAGRGERLSGVVGNRPKCLARVGDCTLLERQIRSARQLGLHPITVVVGFGAEQVHQVCPSDVELCLNARHASTNSLYSMWLVRHLLAEGFVVFNCDVLFHPQLLADLLNAEHEDALLVSARGGRGHYSPEEMKVTVRRGLVQAISKTLPDADSDAENVGIAKFSTDGAAALAAEIDGLVARGAVRSWLPRAFAAFAERRALHAVDTRGLPWIEIDFPEDYWRACSDVLPAIEENSCTNASTTSASGRFRSALTPITCIPARSIRRP